MMKKSISGNIKMLIQQKGVIISFTIIFAFVVINFMCNVFEYKGYDLVDMYHPMKLLLLSDDSGATRYFFLQIFPFLVVLPGGFSYAKDKQAGVNVFLEIRLGKTMYYLSRLLAVFVVTFLVFLCPLMVEIIMNCFSFPIQATGDLSNLNAYHPAYADLVNRYFFVNVFVKAPYIYAMMMNLFVAMTAGVLGMLISAISMVWKIRYKVILFFPIYVLITGIALLEKIFAKWGVSTNYFDYLSLYNSAPKNEWLFMGFIVAIVVASLVIIAGIRKRDVL